MVLWAAIPAAAVGAAVFLIISEILSRADKSLREWRFEARLLDSAPGGPRRRRLAVLAERRLAAWRGSAFLRKKLEEMGLRQTEKLSLAIIAGAPVLFSVVAISTGSILWTLLLISLLSGLFVLWANHRRVGRQESFARQLPAVLKSLTAALGAGSSLQQALAYVAREAPPPAGEEFARVTEHVSLGLPLEEALGRLHDRVRLEELKMVIVGLLIQKRVGGNLVKMVEGVAEAIEERGRLKRNLEVETAQAKLSARVVGLMPALVVVVVSLLDPSYMSLMFTTGPGVVLLLAAVVAEVAGFLVLKRILEIRI